MTETLRIPGLEPWQTRVLTDEELVARMEGFVRQVASGDYYRDKDEQLAADARALVAELDAWT